MKPVKKFLKLHQQPNESIKACAWRLLREARQLFGVLPRELLPVRDWLCNKGVLA